MILKDTILSAFNDRGTLLKWLKKVETALHDSILTDISIDQISETQVKFKFTFENGDFVESPVVTLPRGEKGDTGNAGMDGEAATITIGSVATGAPGTSAVVQNVGTEQDAIFQFVIPRGDKGEPGVSGTQLYHHSVGIVTDNSTASMQILVYSSQPEPFDISTFFNYLPELFGITTFGIYIPVIGDEIARIIFNIAKVVGSNSEIIINYLNENSNMISVTKTVEVIQDDVIPL